MSPWVTSLRKLHYVFPGEADKLLKMAAGLHGLVNHLGHIKAANIGFALPLVPMFYGEETSVDKSSWVAAFTGLLNALIAICSEIEISGGEWVQSYYTDSVADAEATDLQTSELAFLPQANSDEEDALVLQDGTAPIQKFENQLAAFHIKSEMLFHPIFGDWTFSTLHGARATLTVLTLNLDSTLTKTWRSLFTTLDLPMLSKFEIYNINIPGTNSGFVVPSTELLCFLSLHPTIMNLLLHGVENPPETPPERPAILPNLVSISVDPLWLPTILPNNRVELSDAAANFQDQHQHLQSIIIHTDLRVMRRKQYDYDFFDVALRTIVDLPAGKGITLRLRLMSTDGTFDWIEKQAQMGPTQSLLGQISSVHTISIETSRHSPDPRILTTIVDFVQLLRGVHHVELDSYHNLAPAFTPAKLKELAKTCPKMQTIRYSYSFGRSPHLVHLRGIDGSSEPAFLDGK